MRTWYGWVGAVLGAGVGGAAAFLAVCAYWRGDDFGGVISLVIFVPVGMLIGCVLGVATALRVFKQAHGQQSPGQPLIMMRRRIVGLLIGAPTLAAFMVWGGIVVSNPPFGGQPTDQQLLNNFAQHRATFDQLARMVQVNKGLTRVDEDWTDPDNPSRVGVSPTRIREYRRLLRSVGVPRGFSADNKAGQVYFYSWLTGSVLSDESDKGYAYLNAPPPHPLPTLDGQEAAGDKVLMVYRHVEGHWYLFYEYSPDE